jgi:hypothetical protein
VEVVQVIFRSDATIFPGWSQAQAGGVSCLRTELDRHCAISPGKLQITGDKGVGIVDAN